MTTLAVIDPTFTQAPLSGRPETRLVNIPGHRRSRPTRRESSLRGRQSVSLITLADGLGDAGLNAVDLRFHPVEPAFHLVEASFHRPDPGGQGATRPGHGDDPRQDRGEGRAGEPFVEGKLARELADRVVNSMNLGGQRDLRLVKVGAEVFHVVAQDFGRWAWHLNVPRFVLGLAWESRFVWRILLWQHPKVLQQAYD